MGRTASGRARLKEQNRRISPLHNLLGGASEPQSAQGTPAVRRHRNEVKLLLIGKLDQLVCGAALEQYRPELVSVRQPRLAHLGGEVRTLGISDLLIDSDERGAQVVQSEVSGGRFVHCDQRERRSCSCSCSRGGCQRAFSLRAAVERNQDLAHDTLRSVLPHPELRMDSNDAELILDLSNTRGRPGGAFGFVALGPAVDLAAEHDLAVQGLYLDGPSIDLSAPLERGFDP